VRRQRLTDVRLAGQGGRLLTGRRSRGTRRAALIGAALLVLSACTRDDATWASDGPVRTPDPHASYLHFGPGEVFTYGLERVLLDGDLDGRLVKVGSSVPATTWSSSAPGSPARTAASAPSS
jgi:hypothetical protein